MNVDQRFALKLEERDGQRVLLFRATRDVEVEGAALPLAEAGLDELVELAAAPPEAAAALRAAASAAGPGTVFANGWQSWSSSGELAGREGFGRAVLPVLNLYVDGPAPRPRRGEILSYFLVALRSGEHRLVLASCGEEDRALPPVAFRVARRGLGLRIELLAQGGRFEAGQLAAQLRLFCREGWFAAKDALRSAFRGYGRFDRLAFLGKGGSLVPGGYESWYNHYTEIDERIVSRDLEALGSNANLVNRYYIERGKPTVFQVDDGWERAIGDWEPHPAKFPRGVAGIASRAEAKGYVPGLWLAPFLVSRGSAAFRERPEWLLRDRRGRPVVAGWNPGWEGKFHCLDLSIPGVEDYLADVFERVVEDWGFRYLKLDFLYAAFLEGERARPGAAYEHYDRVVGRITSRLRDRKGRPVAWLGCGAPLEPSFRHFPLMRIGADTKEEWDWGPLRHFMHGGRPSAYVNLTHTIARALLDGTVFVNDPDVVFCRESRMRLTAREKELVALVDRMLASQIMFSDDASEFGTEASFTERVVALYDRLEGLEFGAERLSPGAGGCSGADLYRVFSRDGRIRGWINLGDRRAPVAGPEAEWARIAERIVLGGRFDADGIALEPRSISLFSRP